MAKKSKTQKAKASAERAKRKERAEAQKELEAQGVVVPDNIKKEEIVKKKSVGDSVKSFFKKDSADGAKASKKGEKKKPGKIRTFFKDVRSEMKRVTWPSRTDVIQWSSVVLVALVFFGLYTAFLDNAIVMPILLFISGLGA